MRAAVLTTPGEAPAYGEHPDPDAGARDDAGPGDRGAGRAARPAVRLRHVLLRAARPCPYVPGVQGVGVVERSAALARGHPGLGSRRPPAWRPATAASPSGAPSRTTTSSRWRTASPTPALAALGCPAWPRGWRSPGGPAAARGSACWCSAPAARWGRSAIGAAQLLGAGRVVAVCRSRGRRRSGRAAAGADAVVPLAGDVDALAARLADAAGGRCDVVVDPVFGVAATAASRVLADGRPAGQPGRRLRRRRRVLLRRPAQPLGLGARLHQQRADARAAAGGGHRRRRARRRRPAGRRARGGPAGRGRPPPGGGRPPATRACGWCSRPDPSVPRTATAGRPTRRRTPWISSPRTTSPISRCSAGPPPGTRGRRRSSPRWSVTCTTSPARCG